MKLNQSTDLVTHGPKYICDHHRGHLWITENDERTKEKERKKEGKEEHICLVSVSKEAAVAAATVAASALFGGHLAKPCTL